MQEENNIFDYEDLMYAEKVEVIGTDYKIIFKPLSDIINVDSKLWLEVAIDEDADVEIKSIPDINVVKRLNNKEEYEEIIVYE